MEKLNCMRFYLIILIFFYSQCAYSQQAEREVFDTVLGKEKAAAYSMLEKSFDDFLQSNYQNENTVSERLNSYLTDIKDQNINWKFGDSLSKSTLVQLEESGLRKDILLYESEHYEERFDFENYLKSDSSTVLIDIATFDNDFEDIIETPAKSEQEEQQFEKDEKERQKIRDKFPQPNKNGRFYYALAKSQSKDEDIDAYVLLITKYDLRPSQSLIASGFLEHLSDVELANWENMLLVIIEIYLSSLIYNEIMND